MTYNQAPSWLKFIAACVVLNFMVGTAVAQSHDAQRLPSNVFSLSASANGEAANDLMKATVVAQAEGEDAAELQSKVNAAMQWALARTRPYVQIKVKTGDYQTYPTYDRKHRNIVGWRASQSLNLETDDVKAAGEVIKKLQERLQVTGIQFMPKPATRKAIEDQLINEALNAFKDRAALIRDNMGEPDYTLLDINVQTGGSRGPMMRMAETARMSSDSMVEPGLAGGTSQITVQVQGRIQLGIPQ